MKQKHFRERARARRKTTRRWSRERLYREVRRTAEVAKRFPGSRFGIENWPITSADRKELVTSGVPKAWLLVLGS